MADQEQKIKSFKIISKGKLRGVEVTYSKRYVDENNDIQEVDAPKEMHKVEPHPDLVELLRKLSPHFAKITEWETYGEKDLTKPKVLEDASTRYPVRSVIFKGGEDWSGVMLAGHRIQSTGHALNMLTRLVKFEDEAEKYEFAEALDELIHDVRAEVIALLNGKHGASTTPTLFTKQGDGDDGGEGNGDD